MEKHLIIKAAYFLSGLFISLNAHLLHAQNPSPNANCDEAIQVEINGVYFVDSNSTSDDSLLPCIEVSEDDVSTFWYKITGTGNRIELNTVPYSGYEDVLFISIYEGACGNLSSVGCSNDSESDGHIFSFESINQIDYYILLGLPAVEEEEPSISAALKIYEIADFCSSAINVDIVDGQNEKTLLGSTFGATSDAYTAPDCGSNFLGEDEGKGVWYEFLGTGHIYTISTDFLSIDVDDDMDSSIGIYTGDCNHGLTCITGNDDRNDDNYSSLVEFETLEGAPYYILVDGFEDLIHDFELSISRTDPSNISRPSNDIRGQATVIAVGSESPTAGSNVNASAYQGALSEDFEFYGTASDIWFSFNSGPNSEVKITHGDFSESDIPAIIDPRTVLYLNESDNGELIEFSLPNENSYSNSDLDVTPYTDYFIQVFSEPANQGKYEILIENGPNTIQPLEDMQLYLPNNVLLNELIYVVEPEDVDSESHIQSFKITSGNELEIFSLDESTGELRMAKNGPFNETDFSLGIRMNDEGPGELSVMATIQIQILEENRPFVLPNQVFELSENDHMIWEIDMDGIDPNETVQISILTTSESFSITQDGKLSATGSFDFESQSIYQLTLLIEDDKGPESEIPSFSSEETVVIQVSDQNEPHSLESQSMAISSLSNELEVGRFEIQDEDENQSYNWTLTALNEEDAGIFIIDNNGVVSVVSLDKLKSIVFADEETSVSYNMRVDVSDTELEAFDTSTDFEIHILNTTLPQITNDLPVMFDVSEIEPDSEIGTITTDRPVQFELQNGFGLFQINSEGELSLLPDAEEGFDFESISEYYLVLMIEDDLGLRSEVGITIQVTDVNEPPIATTEDFQFFVGAERLSEESIYQIGSIAAIDPDGDLLSYNLDYFAPEGSAFDTLFMVDAHGMLMIEDLGLLFPERFFELDFTVSDGEFELEISVQLIVVTNDYPGLLNTNFFVDENTQDGISIGTIIPVDNNEVNVELVRDELNLLSLNQETNELLVNNESLLDFEKKQSFDIEVILTDDGIGNLSSTETITITINDKNEFAPESDGEITELEIQEHTESGTIVGMIHATDQDIFQTLNYSISNSNAPDAIIIDSSGRLIVNNSSALDFETVSLEQQPGILQLTVLVNDDVEPIQSLEKEVIIQLIDINEKPVIEAINNQKFSELTKLSFPINVFDPEGASLTLELDAASRTAGMQIDESGTFNWTPNEVQDGIYTVTIMASDGSTSVSEEFVLTVLEVNSIPVLTSVNDQQIPEGNTLSFQIEVSDDDLPANLLTLSLDAASRTAGMQIDESGTFSWTPNESQSGDYIVEITASDNNGGTASTTFSIKVSNVLSTKIKITDHIKIYPNPVADVMLVELTNYSYSITLMEVLDLSGQVYLKKQGLELKQNETLRFEMNTLPQGIYLLRIHSTEEKEIIVRKFSKL